MSNLDNFKQFGFSAARISLAAVVAFPTYYANWKVNKEQPVIEEKQVCSNRKPCRKYSDYYDAYYDWMPQATESSIMDAYSEYKESLGY